MTTSSSSPNRRICGNSSGQSGSLHGGFSAGNRLLSAMTPDPVPPQFSLNSVTNMMRNRGRRHFPGQGQIKRPRLNESCVLNLTLIRGPESPTFETLMRTHVTINKDMSSNEVTEKVIEAFSQYTLGSFSLKKFNWGGQNYNRKLQAIDDLIPVPGGEVLKRHQRASIFVVPNVELEIDDEEDCQVIRTYSSTSRRSPTATATSTGETSDRSSLSERDQSSERSNFNNSVEESVPSRREQQINSVGEQSCDGQSVSINTIELNEEVCTGRDGVLLRSTANVETRADHVYSQVSSPVNPDTRISGYAASNYSDTLSGIENEESAPDVFIDIGSYAGETPDSKFYQFKSTLKVHGANEIRIHRQNVLEESLTLLLSEDFDPYKKPKVTFTAEPGVDCGGLRKAWFHELTEKLLTGEVGGSYLFYGPMSNKWPGDDADVPTSTYEAISKFAVCSLVHGYCAFPGFSRRFVSFILEPCISDKSKLKWSEEDLCTEGLELLNVCDKYLRGEEVTVSEQQLIRRFGHAHGIRNISSENIPKIKTKIGAVFVYERRWEPLMAFKSRFEAAGICEFLRQNNDCIDLVFPSFVSIDIVQLVEKIHISSQYPHPSYAIETRAKSLILSFIYKNEDDPAAITELVRAWTGTGNPPGAQEVLKIKAANEFFFRTCTLTLEVPSNLDKDQLSLCIKLGGAEDSAFDSI